VKKKTTHPDKKDSQQELNALEKAYASLKKAGLKRTPNRERILKFLISNHGPFSKEEIQKALPSVDFDSVTLYRNLSQFEKIGLLSRSEFGDGVSRYEFQDDLEHHHHHVICTECRKVESLDSCELPKLESMARRLGFSKIRHSLEFYGICQDCSPEK
jgi:Fur family ferric uptake transcriptional regulator